MMVVGFSLAAFAQQGDDKKPPPKDPPPQINPKDKNPKPTPTPTPKKPNTELAGGNMIYRNE